jgi:major vault protein
VELGRKTVLLSYDESLEVLTLSTGRPKSTDALLKTVFLKVNNNKVSDVVRFETADHVLIEAKVIYNVNFEGDPEKWFAIENYVKYLCDHVRSIIKASVRKYKIADFYESSEDFIRNIVLGPKPDNTPRTGMMFEENGMHVIDVEVMNVMIKDDRIQGLLESAQHTVVKSNIELAQAKHNLDITTQKEDIEQQLVEVTTETYRVKHSITMEEMERAIAVALKNIDNQVRKNTKNQEAVQAQEQANYIGHEAKLKRDDEFAKQQLVFKEMANLIDISMLKEQTDAVVKRFASAQGGFSEALLALSSNEVIAKVAESLSVQNIIGGKNFTDVVTHLFQGSSLEPIMNNISKRISAPKNGNKDTRPTT